MISVASLSIGGAAVATGVALYMLGRRDGHEPAMVVAPTTNGAVISIRF